MTKAKKDDGRVRASEDPNKLPVQGFVSAETLKKLEAASTDKKCDVHDIVNMAIVAYLEDGQPQASAQKASFCATFWEGGAGPIPKQQKLSIFENGRLILEAVGHDNEIRDWLSEYISDWHIDNFPQQGGSVTSTITVSDGQFMAIKMQFG